MEVEKITKARFAASGKVDPGNGIHVEGSVPFSIDVTVDGLSDHLNGGGTAQIGPFAGSVQSEVKISFHCKGSDHLSVPIEYNFVEATGASLTATYTDGKLEGEGGVGPLILLVHTKSGNDCNTDVMKHVISPKGKDWTDGVCNKGLKFYHCRWESPEISYLYHFKLAVRFAGGAITLTNPHVRMSNKGLNVCNLGAVKSAVVMAGGEVPQLDQQINFPGAVNVVNVLLDVGFEGIETMAGNAIGNEAN
jgi:hypothetical protein